MANLPIRDLGGVGVITDLNPYDLPPNAFSDCRNVLFDNGRVSRSPVFKKLFPTPTSQLSFEDILGSFADSVYTFENAEGGPTNAIRFVASYSDPSGGEVALLADNTGEIRTYPNGTLQFATPGSTLVTNDEPWSHTQVAGISVLARVGMVPYGRRISTDENYSLLSGEWGEDDTCAVMRSYLDYMIALNVTKGAIEYPTMVKWSNPIQVGTAVSEIIWDPTSTENSAGENVLADLKSPILDGLVLGSVFIIYAADQVYLMEYTGSSFVFNFRRLFPTGGILNTNCVVEVEGKHFVFGSDDIYVHDGVSKKSIADGRVRRRVYNNLLRDQRRSAFVLHDSVTNLVFFCYKSLESDVSFYNTEFANKAAVYNYRNDTWSFMDLPNVAGGAEITFDLENNAYPQTSQGYNEYNTPYNSFAADQAKLPVMVGITDVTNGVTESRVYGIDLPTVGKISIAPEPEVLKEAFVEKIGIDLDSAGLALRAYKTVTAIIPQAEFEASEGFLTMKIGSTDRASDPIVWRTVTDFRPTDVYKIDTRAAGRYLGYRLSMNSIEDFKFSGFDAEVLSTSRR
jgi:hypothetical protein